MIEREGGRQGEEEKEGGRGREVGRSERKREGRGSDGPHSIQPQLSTIPPDQTQF